MLSWFSSQSEGRRKAAELYGTVVAQARLPEFYAECGISDTPEGRYEMIVLHVALALDRLSSAGRAATGMQRLLIETFVADMDDSMREMGVGDLSVPRKVKRAAAGLYERLTIYRAAWERRETSPLADRLRQSIPGLEGNRAGGEALAGYVLGAREHLEGLATAALLSGSISFPRPGSLQGAIAEAGP